MRVLSPVCVRSILTTVAVIGSSLALAAVLDNFGPPPPGDPSASTGPDTHQNLVTPPPANGVDIPTGAPPSPRFGAQPFTQQMLLFEELGRDALPGAPAGGLYHTVFSSTVPGTTLTGPTGAIATPPGGCGKAVATWSL